MTASRIIVAMSGGVDSSVAAALLADQGFEVLGITLQLWGKEVCATSGTKLCCSVRDALDAKAVAKRLGIQHQTLELEHLFRERVINYFVDGYRQGLTPNPCIACNDHIKFGALMQFADAQGVGLVATGHYARAAREGGRWTLSRSRDPRKDQSYVLFNLTQQQLARARFPLGELSKDEVRDIARRLELATAEKPDSQDVCFVRDRNKDGFLRKELPLAAVPGPITDTHGTLLGQHDGLLGYTIGQREGLGLALGHPVYVVERDQAGNRLVVGSREELLKRQCVLERVNWVSMEQPATPITAWVKIRSRHEPAEAKIAPTGAGGAVVTFSVPQPAVTPGQAAVFYDGDRVLGGGWISLEAVGDAPRVVEEAGSRA